MNDEKRPQPAKKYADSGMSDKAFKNMIFYGSIYVLLFCIGVYFAVFYDLS
ncbi:hypothetical protein GCM10023206_13890 [Acinetobacter puyangensis]|uniref:Uncharacterized protein n=1 Tax=Acinetobacter puyangensis TaxID=1096779 RepID=A0A240E8E6_9GAMM|nr:hypothetical protein [Acinetobacter puyangensis]SNX44892.1 hypothetical protein SAMN05421731_104257 [Acinetobacter puyangensis]